MANIRKRIRKKFEHRIEKAKLKRKEDEVLIERAEELVETDQEIATQILGMVKDPNSKISALGEVQESLESEHIKDVVNTINPDQMHVVFQDDSIVEEIKQMEDVESTNIIKAAIAKTKDESKKIRRLYDSLDILGDYDVIQMLKSISDRYEAMKLSVVSKKIASNYFRFGMAMHIKEFGECLKNEEYRREIPSKTAIEFQKMKKKSKSKNSETKESVEEKITELLIDEVERYKEGEIKKKERDSKRSGGQYR